MLERGLICEHVCVVKESKGAEVSGGAGMETLVNPL